MKFLIAVLLITLTPHTLASNKKPAKIISGWVENVGIENQAWKLKAKLDTGAKTSSIYATNIEQFKKDKQRWVRFTLILKDSKNITQKLTLEKPRARRVRIKNHDGDHDSRVSVKLDLCFDGRHHNTEFTLADRKEYIYGILLGRDFLSNVAVVDASSTFKTQSSCS